MNFPISLVVQLLIDLVLNIQWFERSFLFFNSTVNLTTAMLIRDANMINYQVLNLKEINHYWTNTEYNTELTEIHYAEVLHTEILQCPLPQ